ncbi:MAG: DUF4032 domain-containing protein [Bacteroidetes bacterium]|nr:DUF4032 domain-containing protein [Bacteroidota bacterium]
MTDENIVYNLFRPYQEELMGLPWDKPLSKWNNKSVEFIDVRKGKSKHAVKFIRTRSYSFAVKQTSPINAYFEVDTYNKLLEMGIHTLIPAGYVIYQNELFASKEYSAADKNKRKEHAFIVTVLNHRTIPHSILFKWDFSERNRQTIYKSIAELLAQLHFNNIFWGDASLTNNLIKFVKERDEKGNTRTKLKAFLSDAETVKILPEISKDLLSEDISHFYQSLEQYNNTYLKEDLNRTGISITDDKKYFKEQYDEHYSLLKTIKEFEENTGLNVHKHFFEVNDKYSLDSIYKQIEEHKWYLSEKQGTEVTIQKSADNWIKNVYRPIIKEFEESKISDFFPHTNSVSLYVQIMAHKYYLSLENGVDVGISKSIRSYLEKYSTADYNTDKPENVLQLLIKRILNIFPVNHKV